MKDKRQSQQRLQAHVDAFVECVQLGLSDAETLVSGDRHVLTKRSIATIRHDHITYRLVERYGWLKETAGEVGVHRKGNLIQLIVNFGEFKIKIKKLSSTLTASSIRTQAVIEFNAQQGSFALTPDPTNLHLGYVLDNEMTADASVWITCPIDRGVAWDWKLSTSISAAAPEVSVADITPITPSKPRVTKKLTDEEKEKKTPSRKARGDDADDGHDE